MKLLRNILIIIVLAVSASCQNNGDIGTLFGEWTVDRVVVDGEMLSQYPYGKVFIRFQGNIVALTYKHDNNVNDGAYIGVWSRTPDTLTLDFSRLTTGGSSSGNIPSQLLIPANAKTTFDIQKDTSTHLTLTYLSPKSITLYLRKIY